VLIGGKPTGKRSSYLATSTGNVVAQSTGGGVLSHTVQGKAHFQSFSPNVFIEGEPAVRHLDLLTHNHLTQPGNTPPAVWMSAMNVAGIAGAGPKNLVTRPSKSEGKAMIQIAVVDEMGVPVATSFRIATPGGETIEGNLLWGGRVTLIRLGEGTCRLVLPDLDDLCRRYGTKPAEPKNDQTAYKPGRPLPLATGKAHIVLVPTFRTLWVEIPLVADAQDFVGEQTFTLRSDDGGYEVTKTVDLDGPTDDGPRETILDLEFPGLSRGPKYTLRHEKNDTPGAEVFSNSSFEELFPNEGDEKANELPVHRAGPARATDTEPDVE
jgi:hypothetical protein